MENFQWIYMLIFNISQIEILDLSSCNLMLYADHVFIVCVCWMSHTGPFTTWCPQSVHEGGGRAVPVAIDADPQTWGALSAQDWPPCLAEGRNGCRESSRLVSVCPSVNPLVLHSQGGEQKTVAGAVSAQGRSASRKPCWPGQLLPAWLALPDLHGLSVM